MTSRVSHSISEAFTRSWSPYRAARTYFTSSPTMGQTKVEIHHVLEPEADAVHQRPARVLQILHIMAVPDDAGHVHVVEGDFYSDLRRDGPLLAHSVPPERSRS